MSLFSTLGERFEESKQAFLDGKDAEYVCTSCEEHLASDRDTCPNCGAETVEPVE
ncbi:MAG: hypothetical protein ACOCSN_01025 [Halanaeroarchaeum sp.]